MEIRPRNPQSSDDGTGPRRSGLLPGRRTTLTIAFLIFTVTTAQILNRVVFSFKGTPAAPRATETRFTLERHTDGWILTKLSRRDAKTADARRRPGTAAIIDRPARPERGFFFPVHVAGRLRIQMYAPQNEPFKSEEDVRLALEALVTVGAARSFLPGRTRADHLEYDVSVYHQGRTVHLTSRTVAISMAWFGIARNIALAVSVILFSGTACWLIPVWFVALPRGIGAAFVHVIDAPERWEREQRRYRLRTGRCPTCRYIILHLPERRCPECGETWTEQEMAEGLRRYGNRTAKRQTT